MRSQSLQKGILDSNYHIVQRKQHGTGASSDQHLAHLYIDSEVIDIEHLACKMRASRQQTQLQMFYKQAKHRLYDTSTSGPTSGFLCRERQVRSPAQPPQLHQQAPVLVVSDCASSNPDCHNVTNASQSQDWQLWLCTASTALHHMQIRLYSQTAPHMVRSCTSSCHCIDSSSCRRQLQIRGS